MSASVSGFVAPGFEEVRKAFEENFISRGELGAGVAIFHRDQLVVNLVGGLASEETGLPFTEETLVNIYSVGKAVIAFLLLRQIDAGLVSLEDRIATIWPEYGVHGKERTTVRMALCHQAGVPAIDRLLTNADLRNWSTMTEALAQTAPWHEPGAGHAYHTNTYGHLVGELVRRLAGEDVKVVLDRTMSQCGAEIFVGLDDEQLARSADIVFNAALDPSTLDLGPRTEQSSLPLRSYFNPPGYSSMGLVNSTFWRQLVVPSTNMHATAMGVATFYNELLAPNRWISADLLTEATSIQSEGFCPILGEQATFGLGFTPTTPRRPLGPNLKSFGHFGTGGALGFCDPEAHLAFGYVMNHVTPRWQSTRNAALREALYHCVE